jgi:hypothetical protein
MPQTFWQGLGLGTVVGAVLGEAAKQIGGSIMARRSERATELRKLIRDDVRALQDKVAPMVNLSISYYAKPSQAAVQEANQLRSDLKVFASEWNVVTQRLGEAGERPLPVSALVSLRQALTNGLDTARPGPITLNDPLVQPIYVASMRAVDELSKVRYRSI